MSNVPDIVCKRLCVHVWGGKCTKLREWKNTDDEDPGWGHYCVDRFPDTCKYFEFDSNKIPRCIDCKYITITACYTNSILTGCVNGCKLATEWWSMSVCKNYERKWWKLWRPR